MCLEHVDMSLVFMIIFEQWLWEHNFSEMGSADFAMVVQVLLSFPKGGVTIPLRT